MVEQCLGERYLDIPSFCLRLTGSLIGTMSHSLRLDARGALGLSWDTGAPPVLTSAAGPGGHLCFR